ncbi:MAG: thiamine-phosphate kinase, partial [Thermoplasmata archaeon]
IAFYGGDYELLAAIPRARWARAERAVARTGGRLTRVGEVERGRGAWLEVAGTRRPMPRAGWQPFGPEYPADA